MKTDVHKRPALYRTYRSRSLAELVGQEHVTDVLTRALEKGQFSHAYLLTGPRGVGKTSVARILAHEINGLPYTDDSTDLDIIEIDAASNRRIDDIRDLRERVHIAPSKSAYKVYIIDEVHMLTGESFNALLKTLEEPPAHVIFILATTEIDKLPATIRSRAQTFHFRRIPADVMVPHLRSIAEKEGIDIADDALAVIAAYSEGSLRDAETALDQVRHSSSGTITRADAETTLGTIAGARVDELLGAVRGHDAPAVTSVLKEFEAEGVSGVILARELSGRLLADSPDFEALNLLDALLEVPKSYSPNIKLFSVLMRAAVPKKEAALFVTAPAPAVTAKKATAPTTVKNSAAVQSSPVKAVEPPPAEKEGSSTEPAPSPTAQKTAEEEKPSVSAGATSKPFDWDSLISHVQQNHVVLHSVLKPCSYDFDGETLTLYSKFKLHKTKLDDPKYRTMLQQALESLTGTAPTVTIVFGTKPISDAGLASVAALMGGGEQVNV